MGIHYLEDVHAHRTLLMHDHNVAIVIPTCIDSTTVHCLMGSGRMMFSLDPGPFQPTASKG